MLIIILLPFLIGMFGFGDMAMGAGLQMNGAMDMADGMMLTEMGMPGLGAVQMGIGAMEMGMGQNLMNVGMMQNMYGGYGMGYGMGYGGMMAMDTALMMGCMGIGCTLACCNPGIYRHRPCMGIGCRLPCCLPRRGFRNCMGVGCTLPCCSATTTEVIIIDGNRGGQQQYQNNNYRNQYQNGYQYQGQYQNQGQYVNQNQYVNIQGGQNQYRNVNQNGQQYNNYNPQQQQNYQQQELYQRNNQPQNIQQPKTYQPQNQNQVKPNQYFQQVKTQQISQTLYPQISQYKESIYNGQQIKHSYNVNQSIAEESVHQYKNEYFPSQNNNNHHGFINDVTFNENTVYHGKLFKRIGFNWTEYPQAILTKHNLFDMSVQGMTKVKVKLDMVHQNTSFLKITTMMTQDHLFGCYKNQQLDWFVSIIWAKMALLSKASDRFLEFNGYIEGQILRKSQFLGNWEYRFVKIDASGLKSYRNPQMLPTLTLTGIKQLWCRFEYLHGGNYLVIKCKADGIKYEYGIPVKYAFPWIKAFYSLLI